MSIEGYVVREMTRHEFDLTISRANSEGWNPGIHDAEPFYVTDPKGFFVGIFEGKPVASITEGIRFCHCLASYSLVLLLL
jgi:hypothetical protein